MNVIAPIMLPILSLCYYILLAHIIMSWLINFQVLNLRQPVVAQIWYGLNQLLEPIYRPIRRYLPNVGGVDFSPIILFLGIIILRGLIENNRY
jgi:YggT family protein